MEALYLKYKKLNTIVMINHVMINHEMIMMDLDMVNVDDSAARCCV